MSAARDRAAAAPRRWRGPDLTWSFGALAALAVVFLVVPLVGLLARTPWTRLAEIARDPQVLAALRLSLGTSLAALVLATVLGLFSA